jgi:hypothetical protein
MKLAEAIEIINRGNTSTTDHWINCCNEVEAAILATDWPHGSGSFKLNPGTGQKHPNGVVDIKTPCMNYLAQAGWQTEKLPQVLAGIRMGNLDALKATPGGDIGFEWETGNISSSHRAINKIFHAMLKGGLVGGILVVPAESMRRYLTDRIGNVTELREYFPVWEAIGFEIGVFKIYVVEHDCLDSSVPLIRKLSDGNSKNKKKKPKKKKPKLKSSKKIQP